MNTKISKLNKVIAVLILTMVISSSSASAVQAATFDIFSGSYKGAFVSQTFSFISTYLDINRQNNEKEITADLPLLQNSSIVSNNSPSIEKSVKTVKKIATKIIGELSVPASAYSSTPDQTDSTPFITAWNTHVRDGIVAANFLPFGTKIKIPDIYGDKIFVVEDRMNRRYWHKIDIWFPSRAEALEFGVKVVKIQILES